MYGLVKKCIISIFQNIKQDKNIYAEYYISSTLYFKIPDLSAAITAYVF